MKKKLLPGLVFCVLLALFLLLGGKNRAEEGVTRCLLIGCDRFVSMPGTEPAGANNVETMAALLADFLPEGTSVRQRINGPGTVEDFRRLVDETFGEAKDTDTALIYLSTHGQLKEQAGEPRMALLLSDGEKEEGLEPETLRETLDRVPGKKVLILDACHSGAVIGRGGEGANWFGDGAYRVLVSSGAREESWFWNVETDEYTGTGYFTSAMDSALRASDPEQIDPDGSGGVSLEELTARLRAIHGASTVYSWPEESREELFSLPADRKTGSRLQGLVFGPTERDGDTVILPIHFRAAEPVRVLYQLVPSRNGKWDFEHAVKLPDREKTGLIRGLLNPGEKDRKIRLSVKSIGEDGRALMQIISLRGEARTPAAEAGCVITVMDNSSNMGHNTQAGIFIRRMNAEVKGFVGMQP